MGYKRNEYDKKKAKKSNIKNRKKEHEENKDILLRQMQEKQRLCDADG